MMEEELREVFKGIRGLLALYREIGQEPPPLSEEVRRYLEGERHAGTTTSRSDALERLRAQVRECRRCRLWKSRHRLVFGEGSPRAKLVFVGEAPGRAENREGRPFVGEAGRMLTRIIENGMGLNRQDVYISNVVKCHPPGNRDPEREEVNSCLPVLKKQLNIIGPEGICTLGRVAGQALLGDRFRITRDRGNWHTYMGIPLMPTFHPAYLLRNVAAKRQVWEDIQGLMSRLGMEVKR